MEKEDCNRPTLRSGRVLDGTTPARSGVVGGLNDGSVRSKSNTNVGSQSRGSRNPQGIILQHGHGDTNEIQVPEQNANLVQATENGDETQHKAVEETLQDILNVLTQLRVEPTPQAQPGALDPLGQLGAIAHVPQAQIGAHALPAQIGAHEPPAQYREAMAANRAMPPRQINPNRLQAGPKMKPPIYDGTTSWTDYLLQFELVAELNDWNERTKALSLATSLRGVAQSVLGDLSPMGRHHYPSLVACLNQRFGPENQNEMFWVMLNNRTRKPKETLPELAHEIRRLVKLAHPTAEHAMLEDLSKKHFMNALPDADMRLHIVHSKPRTLDDAVRVAVETEAFNEAEKFRPGGRRPVRAIVSEEVSDQTLPLVHQIHETLLALTKSVDAMNNSVRTQTQASRNKRFDPKTTECYYCHEMGHTKKYCDKLKQANRAANSNRPNMGN